MLAVENGARGEDASRVVVLLTDGTIRSQDTVTTAQKLRREKNVRIFAVQIGEWIFFHKKFRIEVSPPVS